MTDRIKDLENKASGYEADRLPYVQVQRGKKGTRLQVWITKEKKDGTMATYPKNTTVFCRHQVAPIEQLELPFGDGQPQTTFADTATVKTKKITMPSPKPDLKLAQRMRKLGDNLDDKIEYMRRPMTQNPTPKRNKGMRVLEPSAGSGAIADVIREQCPDADLWCIEFNSTLTKLLHLKGHRTTHADHSDCDFMRYPEWAGPWDRIVMNPPFKQRQDITHVLHAYDCLNPGGKLVAVMSEGTFFAQNGTAKKFREWLDERDWDEIDLPAGAFRESGTGVKARIVVIDKE